MPANNRKNMRLNAFLPSRRLLKHVCQVPRAPFLFSKFLVVLLLACSLSCAPANQSSSDSASNDMPELTEELIRERINDAFVREVPELNGTAEPISWSFDESEPKEIAVVEKKMDGERATIVLDIKTRSASYVRNPRSLAGQIRTQWELKTGWALRKWEIVRTENISMKYINIPKPPAQNSNR